MVRGKALLFLLLVDEKVEREACCGEEPELESWASYFERSGVARRCSWAQTLRAVIVARPAKGA